MCPTCAINPHMAMAMAMPMAGKWKMKMGFCVN
jgi:hypothetical protein